MHLSLKDFADILNLSIKVDEKAQTASGWYIRENNNFLADFKTHSVTTSVGRFKMSDDVFMRDGDMFVPAHELAQWLGFEIKPVVSLQQLKIKSPQPLPVQGRYARRHYKFKTYDVPDPVLPLKEDPYKAAEVPAVDVATNSTYRKSGDAQRGNLYHSASVRTAGDFAHGTLSTQSQLNNTTGLNNIRAVYKRESVDGDLLGPLQAKRYELGDVTSPVLPLSEGVPYGFGARMTNTDDLRTFRTPKTAISGTAFPGWDVELYRDHQLVDFQEADDTGFYQFTDVDLYQSDNNFRLVFYGPQGEVREENLYVPVDRNRLAGSDAIYDVAVTLEGDQTYKKTLGMNDEDKGSVNVAALYEKPIFDASTVSLGFRSNQHDGERNSVGTLGFSTTAFETLINGDVGVDDEGDMAAELVARKDIGKHEINDTLSWTGANYDTVNGGGTNDIGSLRNSFRVNGPFPLPIGRHARYTLSNTYTQTTDGDHSLTSAVGLNTGWKMFSINEQVEHRAGSGSDDQISSVTSVTGHYGRNRLRVLSDYKIAPDSALDRVIASYRRDFGKDVDLNVDLQRRYDQALTELSAKLDWQAGFARISPSVTYNSDKDVYVGLNTHFGLLKDPGQGDIHMVDRNVSTSGNLIAFVFLDANGDGKYNDGEEKISGAVVKSVQNGGRQTTDENGIAFFRAVRDLKRTDVELDPNSLKDPQWVPGFDGVSVIPRDGHVAQVNFPVHMSGELDGVLYLRPAAHPAVDVPDGGGESEDAQGFGKAAPVPLRNIKLALYNDKGEVEQEATTDAGGFYYFSRVPPGRYLLIIDGDSAKDGHFVRPLPQEIEVGYNGTELYGHDIYVDVGKDDVPSAILGDEEDYKSLYPDFDFTQSYDLVLNFGAYNSQLLTSLVWYKLRTRYAPILQGADLFDLPSKSKPSARTGKYVLRVGLAHSDLQDAYSRCRALMARDQYCKVEIYPAYMKQAAVDVGAGAGVGAQGASVAE